MKDGIFHTITFASGLLQKERAKPFPIPEGLTKGLEKVSPATRRARKRPTPLRVREVSHIGGRTNVAPLLMNTVGTTGEEARAL